MTYFVPEKFTTPYARRSRSRFWRLVALGVPVLVLVACGGKRRHGDKDEPDAGVSDAQVHAMRDASAGDGGPAAGQDSASGPTSNGTQTFGSETRDTSGTTDPDATRDSNATSSTSDATADSNSLGATDGTNSRDATGVTNGDSSSQSTSEPLLPLPTGCTTKQQFDGDNHCYLNAECGQTTDFNQCSLMPSGRWHCKCSTYNKSQTFEIEGAEGLNACRAAARFCNDDPLEFGDYACIPATRSDEDSCDTVVSCGRPIVMDDLGAAVGARSVETTTSSCFREADGSFACSCTQEYASTWFEVQADSASSACEGVAELCSGGELTPPAEEVETCTTESENSHPDGCGLAEVCKTPVGTVNGVTITDTGRRNSHCTVSGPTTWSCSCGDVSNTFNFEVEKAQASCETTSLNCSKGADIQAAGEAACSPSSQYASDSACEADLECSQAATVDGRAIVAEGRLTVHCRQAEEGEPWWCSCASDQESAVFEFGAPEQTGWEVCAAAPSECMALMPVHLGPYGEYVAPVDPLTEQD